ncbi:MAG TPA: hypothetical protein VHO68_06255, partial [Bacteroidales bacterium]|nr:hypothetical protein [Bacteroidales bacterium]
MKEFLKYTLATITGIIIASFLFFIVLLSTLNALVASGNKPVSINDNSILVLKAGNRISTGRINPEHDCLYCGILPLFPYYISIVASSDIG